MGAAGVLTEADERYCDLGELGVHRTRRAEVPCILGEHGSLSVGVLPEALLRGIGIRQPLGRLTTRTTCYYYSCAARAEARVRAAVTAEPVRGVAGVR